MRARHILPVLIIKVCLISSCTPCSPNIGHPLDLNQFSGQWIFIAGTPINESLSRCGQFVVRQTGINTFTMKYTALSHKNSIPITFNVDAIANGKDIIGTWQLEGSRRKLGPFRHVIAFARYNTVLWMVVCSESTSRHRGYKFAMIWSRERCVPLPILKELKSKLGAYINQGEIRMVDHGNC